MVLWCERERTERIMAGCDANQYIQRWVPEVSPCARAYPGFWFGSKFRMKCTSFLKSTYTLAPFAVSLNGIVPYTALLAGACWKNRGVKRDSMMGECHSKKSPWTTSYKNIEKIDVWTYQVMWTTPFTHLQNHVGTKRLVEQDRGWLRWWPGMPGNRNGTKREQQQHFFLFLLVVVTNSKKQHANQPNNQCPYFMN